MFTEVPAPKTLAPYAAALSLASKQTEDENPLIHGRLVILYDPQGQEAWQGDFRLVMMLHAQTDQEMASDPVIKRVAWDWLHEALDATGADASLLTGTVTVESSESFGSLRSMGEQAYLEVRASWSPGSANLGPQIEAWAQLAQLCSGKEPTSQLVPIRDLSHS
ncbi:hypothetical protein BK816_04645 [Boudabousia tangfeifanii]|uniref:Enoyl-CoA hydratase n=1 Tax=Boudabousia tangfeifanii TaxID=1912795 RepID=A0A1D9MMU7_9ACTO|nr:hypothetical protein BK816_04645 [Boudabousia tangfeifanii]